ncbi:MAG: metal ABC transporter permease [Chloroflexi bacterium]|nr:metal ABC transporter permease [Chloroflexota bacterium]
MPAIFEYDFMVRSLIGGALVGAMAPALGIFLVLRRLSLIADTLSHVALMGVAVGLLTHTMPVGVALASTTLGAVAIEQLRLRKALPGDAAMAVFLYTALAIAVVVISLAGGFNVGLFSYLFGSILTIDAGDLWLAGGLAVVVLGSIVALFSELAQSSFDTDLARTTGVQVNGVSILLAVLTGAAITLSMRIVGVLLVGALIVIPVLASLRVATGLRAALLTAVALGVASALAGLAIAFYANLAAGGAVVLTAAGVLLLIEAVVFLRGRKRA